MSTHEQFPGDDGAERGPIFDDAESVTSLLENFAELLADKDENPELAIDRLRRWAAGNAELHAPVRTAILNANDTQLERFMAALLED